MEIRKIFKHEYVVREEGDMRFKRGRLAMVDRGGIDADGFDVAFPYQPGCRIGVQSREMERAHSILPFQFRSQIITS